MKTVSQRTRKLVSIICAMALLVSAISLGTSSQVVAQDSDIEGEVNLMGYVGIFKENYVDTVVEGCMDLYPGITVNYIETQTSAEMLAQLRTQRDNPQIDLVIMDIAIADTGNKEELFQPIDPEIVTNVEDLHPSAQVADNYGPGVTFDNLVLIYNTETFPEAPTSWNVMWEEEYDGRVILYAPPNIQGLALSVIINDMEGADYKETIQPGIDRLAELGPSVMTFDPQPDAYTIVTAGDADLAIGWNARAQIYADQSEGRMGVVVPEEGTAFQTNTINLVNGSENAEAAQVFMNCALSPEMQQLFSERMYYAPVNTKTELSEEAMERTAASEEVMESLIEIDWLYIVEVRDDWLDLWRRQIIS